MKARFHNRHPLNIHLGRGTFAVENIILRNVTINRGAAEADNHISRDGIFDYSPFRECNIYFIIPNRTLVPLFSTVIPAMVRGVPKGMHK